METDIENLTFMQLWNEFNDYIRVKLKSQSYRKELHMYNMHIVPYFKKYLVKDINSRLYLKWMKCIDDKDYSNSYKKSLHQCMVAILNYAVKMYDLNCNIASKIGGFNKRKGEKKKVDFWTLEEFQKFICAVDDELYKLLFNTLFFTGLRIGECLALTWNDFDGKYLDINKTIAKEKDKNGNHIINSPKTDSSERKIALDNQIIIALKKLYNEQKEKIFFENSWFIFGGIKPLSQTTITQRKNKYCEIANVKKIRLHDFRHSHATLLLSNGVPITVIAKRLGHSDIAMTLNTYSHLVNKDEEKATNLINSLKSNNSALFN